MSVQQAELFTPSALGAFGVPRPVAVGGLLFFLSGAAGLVYEIAWSRELGIFFGHTVHAAAVVLGAYFAGMALGYWLAALILPRIKRPLAAYGVCELCVALWAAVTPVLLAQYARPGLAGLLNKKLTTRWTNFPRARRRMAPKAA